MTTFFAALLEAFKISDTPPRKKPKKPPETWKQADARKTWYQLEIEERAELENRARAVLIAQGHTRPEIVESCSNVELIHLIHNKYSRVR